MRWTYSHILRLIWFNVVESIATNIAIHEYIISNYMCPNGIKEEWKPHNGRPNNGLAIIGRQSAALYTEDRLQKLLLAWRIVNTILDKQSTNFIIVSSQLYAIARVHNGTKFLYNEEINMLFVVFNLCRCTYPFMSIWYTGWFGLKCLQTSKFRFFYSDYLANRIHLERP